MLYCLSIDTLRTNLYKFPGTDDINVKYISRGGMISTNYPAQVLLPDDKEEIDKAWLPDTLIDSDALKRFMLFTARN